MDPLKISQTINKSLIFYEKVAGKVIGKAILLDLCGNNAEKNENVEKAKRAY